ncbi:hypothetical protein EJ03DRAFT_331627 [Teratosphaeria nubilosa]|uniref:Glyoxalase-like domain-containing protein n=1 Tax=Teratosphaeria nubilosa TaxID=161662 RepID=A0A6G1KX30_9PEZI|nr:hypothetical protein EJ03DRAFT_331627 [Teratosphaeria nubilosa]
MSSDPPTQFDHAVLLVPYHDLRKPPSWVTNNFTLSPGGRHADGKTENCLIMFRDGTYLELIAFINDDPEKRKGHWWDKPFGIVDFALTGGDFNHGHLSEGLSQAKSKIEYEEPKEGGRMMEKPRRELRWKVTFPKGVKRGTAPFWCNDVTPRDWRAAATDGNTRHPSGAIGLAGMTVEVPEEEFEDAEKAYGVLTQAARGHRRFAVGTPFDVGRIPDPEIEVKRKADNSDQEPILTLILQSPARDGLLDIEEKVGNGLVRIKFVK